MGVRIDGRGALPLGRSLRPTPVERRLVNDDPHGPFESGAQLGDRCRRWVGVHSRGPQLCKAADRRDLLKQGIGVGARQPPLQNEWLDDRRVKKVVRSGAEELPERPFLQLEAQQVFGVGTLGDQFIPSIRHVHSPGM